MKYILGLLLISAIVIFACTRDSEVITKPEQQPLQIVATVRADTILVTAPGDLAQTNTLYILQNDIVADSTAFSIGASSISFDLNGHTITYGNAGGMGRGIIMSQWNKFDIEVFNGSIIQSINVDPLDETITFQSPIFLNNPSISEGGHFHDLYLEYRSAQTDGIYANYGRAFEIHDNVINDQGAVITNRHSYRGAIAVATQNNGQSTITNVYNNTIQRCRQGGILAGFNTNVFNNDITMESVATNAMGIACYQRANINIYDNIIRGTGFHCIGIGVVSGGEDIEVWGNDVEVQTTEYNPEYGSTHSAAWRTTWDYYRNVNVHHNRFVGYGEADLLPGPLDSQAWVVWVGLQTTGSEMLFHDNLIIADNKGTGAEAVAVAVHGGNGLYTDLRFEDKVIESNYACVYLGSSYGGGDGYALFKNNIFKKKSGAQEFYTIREDGWAPPPSTARFVDNTFQGQTDFEDMWFAWNAAGYAGHSPAWCGQPAGILSKTDIRYAWEYSLVVLNPQDSPMSGIVVEIRANDGELVYSGTTNGTGKIQAYLDEYAITNCDDHLPEYLTLDYLTSGAHKVDYNPYEVTITNGVAVYTTFEFSINDNKNQGIIITKGSSENDPPYLIKGL